MPRPPRKKRPISPSGLKAARALGASGSGHSAAAIGLTLGCGLKPGEICGILADDLDAERMTVTVRGIWRESIGEPNFFVAYPEPSVMRLPAWKRYERAVAHRGRRMHALRAQARPR